MESVHVEKSPKYARLQTTNYEFHPSVVNGIQRMMLNYLTGYMFDMYLDMEDYEFLSMYLKIPQVNPKHLKFTTLSCNTKFPIPMLSLHMSRQAINSEVYDEDNQNLLRCDSRRKVFFALCANAGEERDAIARISKPRVNPGAAPVIIYARELEPFVFTRPTESDPWAYDVEQTEAVGAQIDKIFLYNGKMALIEHGKHINTILKPRLVNGKEDPGGNPCRSSYRWTMNPKFKETHPIVDENFVVRRKIEGQPGPKDMFLMVPTTETTDSPYGNMKFENKFGKPYGLDLMFQFNGKASPIKTMGRAVKQFIEGLNLLSRETARSDSELLGKEQGNEGWSTKLTIPLNVDVNLNTIYGGEFQILLDDGLHHAISVKVLELLDAVIGENMSLWENTAVYYKVPHRLISQIILFVKIPESKEFEQTVSEMLTEILGMGYEPYLSVTEMLIQAAIKEVIKDLGKILTAINKKVEEKEMAE
jgi:hypothetical protein